MSFVGRIFGFIFIVMGITMILQGYFSQSGSPALKGIVQSVPFVGNIIAPPQLDENLHIDAKPYYVAGTALFLLGIVLRMIH